MNSGQNQYCLVQTISHLEGIRKEKKLSFQELSYRTGIDKSNLIRIFRNKENFTFKTFIKIALAMELNMPEALSFCSNCELLYCKEQDTDFGLDKT